MHPRKRSGDRDLLAARQNKGKCRREGQNAGAGNGPLDRVLLL